MKIKRTKAVSVFCLVLVCAWIAAPNTADAANASMSFTSPAGGEVFFPNKTYTIRLLTKGNFSSIQIELSRDGGQTFSSIGTVNTTSRDIAIRNTLVFTPGTPTSADCVLRAIATGKSAVTVTSMPFSVANAASVAAAPGSITGDMLASNTVTSSNIANNSIVTNSLVDGSVTTPKIADGAVTNPKIADLAVNNKKITSGPASNKQVLTADGLGNADWADPNSLGITLSGNAGGDLTGTYPNPSVASSAGNSLIAAINNGATTSRISPNVLPLVGAPYVLKSGDTMNGSLILNADPSSNLHAATKHYVDAADTVNSTAIAAETTRAMSAENNKLDLSGGTLTGTLTLPTTAGQGNALITSINAGTNGTVSSSLLSGALPAIDGSALTAVNATKLQGFALSSATPLGGQFLVYNGITNQWEPTNDTDTAGTVTSITAGNGISTGGAPITNSGTISIDTNFVPQLGSSNVFTGTQTIRTGADSNKGLVVQGFSINQSANLQEWYTKAADPSPVASISPSGVFISTVATGTAPISVASQTLVGNLNSQFLQGKTPSDFAAASGSGSYIQNQTATNQAASFKISGTMIGTAPAGAVALSVTGASGKNIADFTTNGGSTVSIDQSGNFTGNAATASTAGNVTGTVSISNGGTGQITADAAFNALAPSQTGNGGKFLMTDGTSASWGTPAGGGTVTSVTASAPLTSSGGAAPNIALGTVAAPTKADALADAVFGTSAVTQKGLVIQGVSGQSAHLQEWQDSNGSTLSAIDSTGAFTGNASNVSGIVGISNGGTGQKSASAAFDALSPTISTGDLIVRQGASNVRLPVGGNGTVLVADSGSAPGVKWATVTGTGTVTNIDTGTGLTGGPITTTGTIEIDTTVVPQLGAANNFSVDGGLSTPALNLSGNWFTGPGDSTTTKPQLLVEANGATSSGWNTAGTGLGVNASSSFTGNLIDAQSNGTSKFSVDSTGVVTATSFKGPLTGDVSGTSANVTGVVDITNGGTGQNSASAAFNALVPSQAGNGGKFLTTDGTTTSWASESGGSASGISTVTISGSKTTSVAGISVLILNGTPGGPFNLTLTGGTAGQTIIVENGTDGTAHINGNTNASPPAGQSQLLYFINNTGTLHVAASPTQF